MKPLSFASSDMRLGYSAIPSLQSEPFVELDAARSATVETVPNGEPAGVPIPQDRPTAAVEPVEQPTTLRQEPVAQPLEPLASMQQPSTSEDNSDVPQQAALPVYDESKDPYVTSVLRPVMTRAEVDQIYRKRAGGKITLPPMAELPIIDTEGVRTALASASE